MEYFKGLSTLLQDEMTHDRAQHDSLLLERGLQERKLLGFTWYPIHIGNSEIGRGDYLTVTMQKTNEMESAHKFRFGMPVALFSNHAPKEDRITGTIVFVNQHSMRVSFRTDELPDWSRRGKLGVDLMFDENSYKEMRLALEQAAKSVEDVKAGRLIRHLIGAELLEQPEFEVSFEDPMLNDSQNQAIRKMLSGSLLSLLHGPPGTGKTTTLIKAIQALVRRDGKQLLVVAPSNTAVDLLTERLDNLGVRVLRIGSPVRVSEHLVELTLDAQTSSHPVAKEIKDLAKQARVYTDMAQKYKRNFGRSEREQRKALLLEARKIRAEIDRIQDYISEDLLNKAQVITATLVGANQSYIRDRRYETVVIDEAAQALEPACWIPILKANKVILAGDHCQLPPTVKSSQRPDHPLYHTLLEKLVGLYPQAVSFLDTQYRMNHQIMEFPSSKLYEGRLKSAAEVQTWTLVGDAKPIVFIDTAGAGFEESELNGAISNRDEAVFLVKHLKGTIAQLSADYKEHKLPSIGIITPYRGQASLLKETINDHLEFANTDIQINTIDGYQGQEKDIIYISLVRSNAEQKIGFLSDIRRMNVALTRARKKLVVIGDSSTIGQHTFYNDFLAYIESIEAYQSVWEWDLLY